MTQPQRVSTRPLKNKAHAPSFWVWIYRKLSFIMHDLYFWNLYFYFLSLYLGGGAVTNLVLL